MLLSPLLLSLTLAWWCLVFLSSGAGFSGEWTKRLLAEWFGLEGMALEVTNFTVRKSWHVFYYATLVFLFGITIRSFFSSRRKNNGSHPSLGDEESRRRDEIWFSTRNTLFVSTSLALLTAIFDESRQAMSPSRTGTALDVLYDALGIVIAIFVLRRIHGKQ